jgi:hypothetical protein
LGSEEIVEDTEVANEYEIFEQVVERYSTGTEDIVELAGDAVIEEEDKDIPVSEVIKALETLKLFEMQQEDGSEVLLRV